MVGSGGTAVLGDFRGEQGWAVCGVVDSTGKKVYFAPYNARGR
jgi:hypothetical protein